MNSIRLFTMVPRGYQQRRVNKWGKRSRDSEGKQTLLQDNKNLDVDWIDCVLYDKQRDVRALAGKYIRY